MSDEPVYQLYPISVVDLWRDAAKAADHHRAAHALWLAEQSRWGRFKYWAGQSVAEARYRVLRAWDVLRGQECG